MEMFVSEEAGNMATLTVRNTEAKAHAAAEQRQEKQWVGESGRERHREIESKGWSAPAAMT